MIRSTATDVDDPTTDARWGRVGRAGYRMLYQDYKDGGFAWDVTYKGPVVGITTRF